MEQPVPLVEAVNRFIEDHSLSPVTFGREAMNDPHFVRDINKGRRLWPETEAKVRRFMADYIPPAQAEASAA